MATFAPAFVATERALLPSLRAGLVALRDYRNTLVHRHQIARELHAHTDRELADMGITRSDIPAIVRGTFQR